MRFTTNEERLVEASRDICNRIRWYLFDQGHEADEEKRRQTYNDLLSNMDDLEDLLKDLQSD